MRRSSRIREADEQKQAAAPKKQRVSNNVKTKTDIGRIHRARLGLSTEADLRSDANMTTSTRGEPARVRMTLPVVTEGQPVRLLGGPSSVANGAWGRPSTTESCPDNTNGPPRQILHPPGGVVFFAKRQWESLQSREQSNQVELFNYLEDLEATIADAKKDIEGLTIENLWLKHDIHQLLRHMEGYGIPRSAWEVVTKLCVVSDLQIIRENGSQVGRVTKVHRGDADITNQHPVDRFTTLMKQRGDGPSD